MADIQIVFVRKILPITRVNLVSLDPPIVAIEGQSFDLTSEVRINGYQVEFFLLHERAILAGVPDSMSVASIETVEVFTSEPAEDTQNSKLDMLLGSSPRVVSGIQRLVQSFLKILFTTPQTNIFCKNQGGGALQIIGMVDGEEATKVTGAFSVAVDRTKKQIMSSQTRNAVPSTERLLDASLISSAFDSKKGALIATILLISYAREEAIASMTL